jgi:uncharacterized membrane protein YphA (DoxX/SURF4 family)
MNKLNQLLFKKIDADNLSLFRVLFGCVLVYDMLYLLKNDFVFQCITGPVILFKYPFFDFIEPLSKSTMDFMNIGMALLAILILIGVLTRWALVLFLISFCFFFLQDTTLYNNHLYLFALITFLMIFLKSDVKYSVQNYFRKEKKEPELIPQWHLWILRFQICLVYFYGGLAKLNPDWLSGNVAHQFIKNSNLSASMQTLEVAKFIAISGTIFDLCIPFLLLFKRTRWVGIIAVLIFNITNNSYLFNDIGVFPTFMVFSLVLFFDPGEISGFFARIFGGDTDKSKPRKSKRKKKEKAVPTVSALTAWNTKKTIVSGFLFSFILFQLLVPLRHYFMTYNPEWTGVGQRFSWRMKMQTHRPDVLDLKVLERNSEVKSDVDMRSYLSKNQQAHFFDDPRNMVQLAKKVKEDAMKQGFKDPVINSSTTLFFNGHPSQYLVYPDVDLTTIDENSTEVEHWVYPLGDQE